MHASSQPHAVTPVQGNSFAGVSALSAPAIQRDQIFGMLAPLLEDPHVTDILVNGHQQIWVDRGKGLEPTTYRFSNEKSLRGYTVGLIAAGGRHIDQATPFVDVRLGDGIRVHAILSPVARPGTLVSIRIPSKNTFDLRQLTLQGFVTPELADMLRRAVLSRQNILICGAAGSGKTTLLAALLTEVPARERIICIEDVAELALDRPNVVSLEARQANVEGTGFIALSQLLVQSLRMRPDRIVVGECRGAEVRELLTALNTGHSGGAGTIHCNSMSDLPARLAALGALAGMSDRALAKQVVSAIDLVVQMQHQGSVRMVSAVGKVLSESGGGFRVVPLTTHDGWDGGGVA